MILWAIGSVAALVLLGKIAGVRRTSLVNSLRRHVEKTLPGDRPAGDDPPTKE